MEHDPQAFEFYAEGKAFVLLYEFHALRFPDMPVHHYKFRPYERKYLPEDASYVAEEILTEHGLTVIIKEQEIRRQFRDMLHAPDSQLPPDNAYGFVLQLCEAARQDFHAEEDLSDAAGRPLSSREILPPPYVIEAMTEDFVWHRRQHCRPLEQFIAWAQPTSA